MSQFKGLHTVGIGKTSEEAEELYRQGRKWIKEHIGLLELDYEGADLKAEEIASAEKFLGNVDAILMNGAKLIIDRVYDSVGFNRIGDEVLRHLVVARLCQPMSKSTRI